LRPEQRVFAAEDAAGMAPGAAMLAHWPPAYPMPQPRPINPTPITGIGAYRGTWTAALAAIR
jgi:hypothetical protein